MRKRGREGDRERQTERMSDRESRGTLITDFHWTSVRKKNLKEIEFVSLLAFLTYSSTTRLYCGRAPRQSVNFMCCHTRDWETMTSVSVGHIILTPTQPVGSGRPQREQNPGPPH